MSDKQKTPKFKNHFNAYKFNDVGEINLKPSQTIPDQSMSIKEILTRYAKGLPLGGERVPIYEGEDDIMAGVDYDHLDLAEKQEIRESVQSEIRELNISNSKAKSGNKSKDANILENPVGDKKNDEEKESLKKH